MSAWRKLWAFAPQIVAVALSTAASMLAYWLRGSGHGMLMVPAMVFAAATGAVGGFTTLGKVFTILDEGWKAIAPAECKRCRALAREVDSLRHALVELKP